MIYVIIETSSMRQLQVGLQQLAETGCPNASNVSSSIN